MNKLKLIEAKKKVAAKKAAEAEGYHQQEEQRAAELKAYLNSVRNDLLDVAKINAETAKVVNDALRVFDNGPQLKSLKQAVDAVERKLSSGLKITNINEAKSEPVDLSKLPTPVIHTQRTEVQFPDWLAKDETFKQINATLAKLEPSQRAPEFLPFRRVIKSGNTFKFDDSTWSPSAGGNSGGGSSGGGATTIADGADVAEGSTTDAAVDTDTTGTVSGKLRGLVKLMVNYLSRFPVSLGQKTKAGSLPVTLASDEDSVTVDGTVSVAGVATASNQTDGTQKTQIVDAGGEATTVTGGKLDVNASVTINSEKAEDSSHTTGDTGSYVLGVRSDTQAAKTSADNEYSSIAVDDVGRPIVATAAYSTRIDEASSTVTYLGNALCGTATSAASWQVKKIDSSSGTSITFADGDPQFNNVWDNRASLSYS